MYTNYKINLGFDTLYMKADLSQASATIYTSADPDEYDWEPTQYQTADASHNLDEAAILAVSCQGRDYWMSPDDEGEIEDDDAYIACLICGIEEA